MLYEPGCRVVAVRDADETTVRIYGYGVYAGKFARPGSGDWSDSDREMARTAITGARSFDAKPYYDGCVERGEITRSGADMALERADAKAAAEQARPIEERVDALLALMDLNPRIDLDSGDVVWGYQCWWGDIAGFEKFCGARNIEYVDVGGMVGNNTETAP